MRQNKFTKIQFDIADDGITNRSTIGGKACVFEPVQNTFKNRNIIGKLKTLQTASVESLSKNFKNLIQKLRLSEFLQQTLGETTDSNHASIPKRQNLWELPQQTLSEETDSDGASIPKRQNLWELPQQTLGETTDSNRASTRKRQNLWELPQQTLGETTGIQIQKTESKGLGMDLNTSKIMNIGFEGGKRISIQNTGPVKNRFSLRTKLTSLM
ncbi:hypothetical protein Q4565_18690, partial [Leptospira santarosai]|nr:hypothetical protein [Leptospira santarosai]